MAERHLGAALSAVFAQETLDTNTDLRRRTMTGMYDVRPGWQSDQQSADI